MDKKGQPSAAQLRAWRMDEVSQWVFKQMHHRHPDYRQSLPLHTQEQSLRLNYQVGCRTVMEDLEKLAEKGEF